MITLLYFPTLFDKDLSHFDDMGGRGGKPKGIYENNETKFMQNLYITLKKK